MCRHRGGSHEQCLVSNRQDYSDAPPWPPDRYRLYGRFDILAGRPPGPGSSTALSCRADGLVDGNADARRPCRSLFTYMPGTEPTRRRNAPETRARILLIARRQFAERAYTRVRIGDIAAAAAVNQALVIRYFGSKQRWQRRNGSSKHGGRTTTPCARSCRLDGSSSSSPVTGLGSLETCSANRSMLIACSGIQSWRYEPAPAVRTETSGS